MAKDIETQFHETWLGEVQPLEGLTFTVPVLADAGVMVRLSPVEAATFGEHVVGSADPEGGEARRIGGLRELMLSSLGWRDGELVEGDALGEDLALRLADEGTELRPDFAVVRAAVGGEGEDGGEASKPDAGPLPDESTPTSRAGEGFQMLGWELPAGLDLDKPESETNTWHYPPSAKFERLLRETRVPVGLLSNGDVVRLMYCPHGESTGWLTFHVAPMATPAGRDMLSAFRELLHADRVLSGSEDTPSTLRLLEESRERQADVTTQLGEQLLDALHILLQGFEAAAHRDGDAALRAGLQEEGNHVYEGLLTVMLRLVFVLYAEDRGLLPSEHPVYSAHLSVSGLYDQLQADSDLYGDTMAQRFGAWPRLVALFRSLYFGVEHGDLTLPPHRGLMFNPERFAFLEGWMPGGAAPTGSEDRAGTQVPSVADGVVHRVLRRMLYLDGQRLSYRALDEEQLGSVYEGLMGFRVERRGEKSVCLKPSRVWVSPVELVDRPAATRVRWLQDNGVPSSAAKRIAKAVIGIEKAFGKDPEGFEREMLALLRKDSVAGRGKSRRGRKEEMLAEVAPGRLVIQPGEERRRTSSHYTPRSLSGPIVRRTLEPLLLAMQAEAKRKNPELVNPQPGSEDLLCLKICDPAMGSGAFLVEACRFLADQVVAAWVREGVLEEIVGAGDGERKDPIQVARRMVAQRCLYGVDKNPLAVELGKLSLWLLTLSKGQTFAFLDHCLKSGDSLVGLSQAQILAMDWAVIEAEEASGPKKKGAKKSKGKKAAGGGQQFDLFAGQTRRAFAKASRAREKLAALARRGDVAAVETEQRELHVEAEWALQRLRDVADVLLSSYFFPDEEALLPEFLFAAKKPSDKARRACLVRVRDELNIWLQDADAGALPGRLELRRALVREGIRPLYWELEFPEVFADDRLDPLAGDSGGAVWMDAVVGNPPFMGKNGITNTGGPTYLDWLTSQYTPSHGNSDLSAYFFRRAHWMLGVHGTLGLIATNTIGQGDTRTTGLQPLVLQGGRIHEAKRDMKWPVKGANVSVSVVHVAVGNPDDVKLGCRLDGESVSAINSRLRPKPERADPVRLGRNAGKSFVGSYVLGSGFTLTPDERESLIASSPKNAERISPYLGGEELNSSPTQSHRRYVIDFGDMSLDEAEAWPELLAIVREKVKPERDKNKRETRRKYWWKFGERAPKLYRAIRPLERCLATAQVTKHVCFSFMPTGITFSQKAIVFPLSEYAEFGVLQSRLHISWCWLLSSTMRSDLNYSPSDCFATFPFPAEKHLSPTSPLSKIATTLYTRRADHMVTTDLGLTKTYNALKDPDNHTPEIIALRDLHVALDREVLRAYNHPEIHVPAYVGASPSELERFEDEVLDMLFADNERQAKAEARAAKRANT